MDVSFLKHKDISFKEKVQNFWVYYKFRIIAVLLVIVIAIFAFATRDNDSDYDIRVVMNIGTVLPQQSIENLTKELEKYCPDFNGDGKRRVKIIDCSYDIEELQKEENKNANTDLQRYDSKFSAQFGEAKKMLYIMSQSEIDRVNSQTSYSTIVDGEASALSGTKLETAVFKGSDRNFDGCYIFVRSLIGSVKKDKDSEKYHGQAQKMLEIINKNLL